MKIQREELNFLLQKADVNLLKSLYEKIDKNSSISILSQASSQTLLIPVKDPISGGEFYAGEVLVTSTIVEVNKKKGWSMVQDDKALLSLYISVIDAVFQDPEYQDEIINLCLQTKVEIQNSKNILNKKINSTKVNFDLMEG